MLKIARNRDICKNKISCEKLRNHLNKFESINQKKRKERRKQELMMALKELAADKINSGDRENYHLDGIRG